MFHPREFGADILETNQLVLYRHGEKKIDVDKLSVKG